MGMTAREMAPTERTQDHAYMAVLGRQRAMGPRSTGAIARVQYAAGVLVLIAVLALIARALV
jgi:hypothetical protein